MNLSRQPSWLSIEMGRCCSAGRARLRHRTDHREGIKVENRNAAALSSCYESPIPVPTVFAEFETNLRRERQLEGIADAKARGVYQGRKASIDPAKVKELRAQGMGASAIAKALKIGRASVYRALEA